jgi:hypothetical protein
MLTVSWSREIVSVVMKNRNLVWIFDDLKTHNIPGAEHLFGTPAENLREIMRGNSRTRPKGEGNRSRRRLGWRVAPTAGPELARETALFYASL